MKQGIKNALKKMLGFFGFIGSLILFIFGYKLGRNKRFDIIDRSTTDYNTDSDWITDRTGDRNRKLTESIERSNKRQSEIDRITDQARKTNIEAENLINRINNST